jgi:hypothetical protein
MAELAMVEMGIQISRMLLSNLFIALELFEDN